MGSNIKFYRLVELFERTAKGRFEVVQNFMNKYRQTDDNLYPLLQLMCPELEKSGRVYNIQTKTLTKLLIEALRITPDSSDALRLQVFKSDSDHRGKFSDVVYDILRGEVTSCASSENMTIADVNKFLDQLGAHHNDRSAQSDLMKNTIRHFSAREWKWLCRIILRDMNNGITEELTLRAFHPDAVSFYNVHNNDLKMVCQTLKDPQKRLKPQPTVGVPLVPMCCQRPGVLPGSLKRAGFEEAGCTFYIDTKMDGERLQIHKDGDKFTLYSRNGIDYTSLYQWIVDEIRNNQLIRANQCIIDGEICAWCPENAEDNPEGYFLRQTQIKPVALKDPQKMTPEVAASHLCVSVFDILHHDGRNLTDMGLSERRKIMGEVCLWKSRVFEPVHSSIGRCIKDAYQALFSLTSREEGVVLKLSGSEYTPGARDHSSWFKLKPDYLQGGVDTFDCVIIGSKYKYGKLHEFVVGVADNFPEGIFADAG